jgi:hypothetical protein
MAGSSLGFKGLENFQYIMVDIDTMIAIDLDNRIFGYALQKFKEPLLIRKTLSASSTVKCLVCPDTWPTTINVIKLMMKGKQVKVLPPRNLVYQTNHQGDLFGYQYNPIAASMP